MTFRGRGRPELPLACSLKRADHRSPQVLAQMQIQRDRLLFVSHTPSRLAIIAKQRP